MNGIVVRKRINRILIWFGCFVMVVLSTICICYAYWYREQIKITQFDVSTIQDELDYFPYDGAVYYQIVDGKDARRVAASVLSNKIDSFKSFGYRSEIYYDSTYDIWQVRYYQHHHKLGEYIGDVYDVVMTGDGIVIAFWGEK